MKKSTLVFSIVIAWLFGISAVNGQSGMGNKICNSVTNFEFGIGPAFLSNCNVSDNLTIGLNIGTGLRFNFPTRYFFFNVYGNFKDFKANVNKRIKTKEDLQFFNAGIKLNFNVYQTENKLKSLYAYIDLSRNWTNFSYEYTIPSTLPFEEDDTDAIRVFKGKFNSIGIGLRYHYHILFLDAGYTFARTQVEYEKNAAAKLADIGIQYKNGKEMRMNNLGFKIGINVPFIGKNKYNSELY